MQPHSSMQSWQRVTSACGALRQVWNPAGGGAGAMIIRKPVFFIAVVSGFSHALPAATSRGLASPEEAC